MDSDANGSMSGSSEIIEEDAARWFARRQSGGWTDADQTRFDAWLAASTAHRIQYIRAETSWNQAARMKALGAGVPAGIIPPRGSWGDARFFRGTSPEVRPPPSLDEVGSAGITIALPRRPLRKRTYVSVAAALVLALGVYLINITGWRGDRFTTPVGGMDMVPLADGSKVILNTNSRIRVALNETERRVELDQGEAFFDVARDTARPFVVDAGSRRIVVLGTKFSVRRDGEDVRVVVTEGRVRLEDGRSGTEEPATQLEAGAVAQTAKAAVIVQERPAAEMTRLLSWRSGYVSFRDTELHKAVAEFNRYSTRRIVIEDPAISDIRIGGNFRTSNADAFLWLLKNGLPIRVEQHEDRIVLTAQ